MLIHYSKHQTSHAVELTMISRLCGTVYCRNFESSGKFKKRLLIISMQKNVQGDQKFSSHVCLLDSWLLFFFKFFFWVMKMSIGKEENVMSCKTYLFWRKVCCVSYSIWRIVFGIVFNKGLLQFPKELPVHASRTRQGPSKREKKRQGAKVLQILF